jgi:excisionase family DNA binding protein
MLLPECARYIGRTPGAVRKLVERGQIPFHRVRGRYVFGSIELDTWVRNGGSVMVESPHIDQEVNA